MKVLVVSMLRIGDLVCTSPILDGLRRKHGSSLDLHILINKQFEGLVPLLPKVEKIYRFDRKQIQLGLGEYNRPLFESADRVRKLVNRLNREEYDLVINLTQNRLSGYLCGLVDAKSKRGMVIESEGQFSFGSKWFEYLNNHVARGGREILHYVDVFKFGSNLGAQNLLVQLHETDSGKLEAEKLVDSKNYVCVQPLTSDAKKNWGLASFVESLKVFSKENQKMEIVVLGAPFERPQIEEFVALCAASKVKVRPAICSLSGAFSLLKESRGLLTGDTSIKHMASATTAPIVEICLGSSDFRKTGTYRDEAYIIASKESCYPCSHFDACTKASHLCGQAIDPKVVGRLFSAAVKGTNLEIVKLAKEVKNSMKIYQTEFSDSGFWCTKDLAEGLSEDSLASLIDMASWKLLNRNEHKKMIGEYGTEGQRVQNFIINRYSEATVGQIGQDIENLEGKYVDGEKKIDNLRVSFTDLIKNGARIDFDHPITKEMERVSGVILDWDKNQNNSELSFRDIRNLQNLLSEEADRTRIKIKVLRSLKSQLVGSI